MLFTLTERLELNYAAMSPNIISLIKDLVVEVAKGDISQEQIVNCTIHNEVNTVYPPSIRYQRKFIRSLINDLESKEIEVDSCVYDAYGYLLSCRSTDTHYRTFTLPDADRITVVESSSLISNGTTGLHIWEASGALIDYCKEIKQDLCGRKILELGSGVGYGGLAIVKEIEPKEFIFSDCHRDVLNNMKANISLNILPSVTSMNLYPESYNYKETKVALMDLDWTRYDSLPEVDTIIASDILYDVDIIPSIISLLENVLSSTESKAIVAATIRNEDTIQFFIDSIGKSELKLKIVKEMCPEELCPIKVFVITKTK